MLNWDAASLSEVAALEAWDGLGLFSVPTEVSLLSLMAFLRFQIYGSCIFLQRASFYQKIFAHLLAVTTRTTVTR